MMILLKRRMINITGIIITLILGLIFTSLLISKVKLEYEKSLSLFGNIFSVITIYTLYSIFLNNLVNSLIKNDVIDYLITGYLGGLLFLIISTVPIVLISIKKPDQMIKIFKLFDLLSNLVFFPISFIGLAIFNVLTKDESNKMTEDEFLEIVEEAEQKDGITANESKLIKNVLEFHDLKVSDIYTPRVDVIAIEKDTDPQEILDLFIETGFSRLPLYEDDIDNIIGIINYKDLYAKVIYKNQTLKSIVQAPLEITEYMEVTDLLSLLRLNKAHMAIVKDEFGGTLGIVTMEDILEELVGDIWDEHDVVVQNIKPINGNKYLVLGSTYLDDLAEELNIEEIDDEDYSTVNGWVLANLGKMGVQGDKFTYENLEVVVKKATNKQIVEVEIKILDK